MREIYVAVPLPDGTIQIIITTVDELYGSTLSLYYSIGIAIARRCEEYVPAGISADFFGRRLGRTFYQALVGERHMADLWRETVQLL